MIRLKKTFKKKSFFVLLIEVSIVLFKTTLNMKTHQGNLKLFLTVILLFFITTFSTKVVAQTAPTCTNELNAGNQTFIITSGQVFCVPPNSSFNGSLLVRSGGHLIVCVNGTFTGSVTIDPGGTLWDSPTTTYTGALAVNGTRNRSANSCIQFNPCTAPSAGT